jgi:SAM-dependent methyltransferase
MTPLAALVNRFSRRARARRAEIFSRCFDLHEGTKILDLGSQDGAHIHAVLEGTRVRAQNIFIADIDARAIARGREVYGYQPVLIAEAQPLPFPDGFFDVVYCSSVIEHVTVPKQQVWSIRSGEEFRRLASARQREFAREVARLGRQYFVQTPNRGFVIESHSWLPLLGYLPRRALLPVLQATNQVWIKRTAPDWNLLNERELAALFTDALILRETFCGMTKSLMAIRSSRGATANEAQPATLRRVG